MVTNFTTLPCICKYTIYKYMYVLRARILRYIVVHDVPRYYVSRHGGVYMYLVVLQ